MKKLSLVLLALTMLACSNNDVKEETEMTRSHQISSYVRTWPLGSTREAMTEGKYWTAEDIQGDKISSLIIAFGLIRNETEIFIPDLEENDEGHSFGDLKGEVAKLHEKYPELKVNFSVGGWGADGFSDMAMEEEKREVFVKNLVEMVKMYGFDGVDIDWEYPVNGGWGTIKSRPEDRENFTFLMEDIREALDLLEVEMNKEYSLSFAAYAGPAYFEWVEIDKLANIADYAKLMTYDFYGGWNQITGHLANLYNNSEKPEDISVDKVVQYYLSEGFPAEKLIMGVPFYGRAWGGVTNENNGLFQNVQSVMYTDGISYPDIKELIANGYTRYWDDEAKAPYLYNGDVFVTYEDAESLTYKAEYVKKMGLGGIMIWEYGHDMESELTSVIDNSFKK